MKNLPKLLTSSRVFPSTISKYSTSSPSIRLISVTTLLCVSLISWVLEYLMLSFKILKILGAMRRSSRLKSILRELFANPSVSRIVGHSTIWISFFKHIKSTNRFNNCYFVANLSPQNMPYLDEQYKTGDWQFGKLH